MGNRFPIIYVRGYAGTRGDVEETVDDLFYGFNLGSTHIRVDEQGPAEFYAFESPFVRLMTEHGYTDVFNGVVQAIDPELVNPAQTIWIHRYSAQKFEQGFLSLRDHIERLPVWSDYLIAELRPSESPDRE